MTKLRRSRSGYRGVAFYHQKWRAEIRYKGWRVASPSYSDRELAALIRDACAKRLFGETTYINRPEQQLPEAHLSTVEDMVFRALAVAKLRMN